MTIWRRNEKSKRGKSDGVLHDEKNKDYEQVLQNKDPYTFLQVDMEAEP